jgi:hypothetical protein
MCTDSSASDNDVAVTGAAKPVPIGASLDDAHCWHGCELAQSLGGGKLVQELVSVDTEQFAQFAAALNASLTPNAIAGLERLMAIQAPWDIRR